VKKSYRLYPYFIYHVIQYKVEHVDISQHLETNRVVSIHIGVYLLEETIEGSNLSSTCVRDLNGKVG